MTLKGKKNHYNVKLLKGYGTSISLKNKKVCVKGGRDVFTGKQEIEEWFVSQMPYEKIVIAGKGLQKIFAPVTSHLFSYHFLESICNPYFHLSY
jgi:hypothetical protein